MRPDEALESLVATPDGDLVAGSECAPDGMESSIRFHFRPGLAPDKSLIAMGTAQTMRANALVDMDRLPDGDDVGLARFYFPGLGNKTASRLYPAAGLTGTPPPSALKK
jgi:hypothetical protein